jgi:hypothetical protein
VKGVEEGKEGKKETGKGGTGRKGGRRDEEKGGRRRERIKKIFLTGTSQPNSVGPVKSLRLSGLEPGAASTRAQINSRVRAIRVGSASEVAVVFGETRDALGVGALEGLGRDFAGAGHEPFQARASPARWIKNSVEEKKKVKGT